MPKEIEEKIRASVRQAHPEYSEERVNEEVYATMNKKGLLHMRRGKKQASKHD